MRKNLLTAFLMVLVICFSVSACRNNTLTETTTETTEISLNNNNSEDIPIKNDTLLECRFYNENDFNMYDFQSKAYDTDSEIRCGVVPHHLLAGKMIAGFFKTAAQNNSNIDTVVIVAPIHEPKNDKLCTSMSDWKAPDGILKNDTDFSERFITKLGAVENDEVLQSDHSASALIPFVKHYLPSASVACLLVARNAGKNMPDKISEMLSDFSEDKNCLFVFSVDFSHYLKPDNTRRHDEETLAAVMNCDLERIASMTNDNMDSPICIGTFLRLANNCGWTVSMLDHSNSLEISKLPYTHPSFENGLTSYFIFAGT
jgi:AmmeMemoRadiSam system protein B